MEKKDYLKFFCGFFFSSIIIFIAILLLGVMPFTIKGFVFDYSFWTMGIVLSCLLVVVCAYLGWERKQANRISVTILLFLSLIVFANSFYFMDSKDYIFDNNYASSEALINKKAVNDEDKDRTYLDNNTYDFAISSDRNDYAKSVALDEQDSMYITGSFSGSINLDQNSFERTSLGGVGGTNDIYVVKYDSKKKFVWGFTIGSVGDDMPNSIKIGRDGNLYLIGKIGGKVDFDPGEKEYILDSGVGQDGFVAKFDLNGNFIWARIIGNPEIIPFVSNDVRFEDITAIDIDNDNNVLVAGYFDGIIEFKDVNGNISTFANANQKKARDIFIVKYDANGNYISAFALFGEGRKEVKGILVDEENNIYLAGDFNSKISFDNNNLKKITYTTGGKDLFLAKYSSDFSLIWSKKWGSAGNDYFGQNGMIFDKEGKILLGGNIGGYINIEGFKKTTDGSQDGFWMKINRDGKVEYVNSFGGSGTDGINAIQIDSLNNVYLGGYFNRTVNFGLNSKSADSVIYTVSSGEATDSFLAKYGSKGEFSWVNSFGGDVSLKEEIQEVSSLAIDKLDYPIIAGNYYKDLKFNSSPELDLSAKGLSDGIIIKYNPEGGIK